MSNKNYEEIWQKIYELRSRYTTSSASGEEIPRVLLTKPDADYIYKELYPFIRTYKADDPRLPDEVERLLKENRENNVVLYQKSNLEIEVYCGTMKSLKQQVEQKSSGCFIATAVYGSPLAQEVVILRSFRDKVMAKSPLGKVFITGYYRFSPFYARLISQSETLKKLIRVTTIDPLVRLVKSFLKRKT